MQSFWGGVNNFKQAVATGAQTAAQGLQSAATQVKQKMAETKSPNHVSESLEDPLGHGFHPPKPKRKRAPSDS